MGRTANSLRNLKFTILFQTLYIAASFFNRSVFVHVLTKEYLGLSGTFGNLLSMLSLAELGLGTAVTFSLYGPLAKGDQDQIILLMGLCRKAYRMICGVVLLLGVGLMPFLPVLMKDLPDIPHLRGIYLMFVMNSVLSYFHVYKQTLIIADQKQYLVTSCTVGMKALLQIGQAAALLATGSYLIYLGLQLVCTLSANLLLSRKADKLYPYLSRSPEKTLDPAAKTQIQKNIKALIIHKIGGVAVFGTDNLLISGLVGVVEVGLYSNYVLIVNALYSVYTLMLSSVTACIGNLGATGDKQRAREVFFQVEFAGRWLYSVSAICLAVLLNPFIRVWLGGEYCFPMPVVVIIAANFYVTGMRKAIFPFREAYGLYWYDRHKPLAESVINIAASIALGIPFGVSGILLGTFISTMTTCFWIEPVVIFRYGLEAPWGKYFLRYGANTALTLAAGALTWGVCRFIPGAGVVSLVQKALVCALLPNGLFLLCYGKTPEFKRYRQILAGIIRIKRK